MNVPQPATTGGSSSVPLNKNVFASQDGLLHLLIAIRGSSMPSEEKMAVRDAVLEYSQQTDPADRAKIQQDIVSVLSPYQADFAGLFAVDNLPDQTKVVAQASNLEPAVAETPAKPASGFGNTRPVPKFSPAVTKTESQPTPPEPPLATDVIESKPEITEPVQPPEPALPKTTPSAAETVNETPPPDVTDTPAVAATGPVSLDDHMNRIKAIKRHVNEKVGNPINLIDTNNDIGREYMNALLEAMKKVSSSDGAGADTAMKRLEAAYQAVQELLATGVTVGNKTATKIPKVETTPAEKSELAPQLKPEPETASAMSATPTPATPPASVSKRDDMVVNKIPIREVKLPTRPSMAATRPMDATSPPAGQAEAVPTPPVAEPAQLQDTKPKVSTAASRLQLHSLADDVTTTHTTQAESNQPKTEATQPVTKEDSGSLWSRLTGGSSDDKNTEAIPTKPTSVSSAGDNLLDSKVEAGLQQLLSEWKLFKSSGLLGTGPNGKDHPLYKTLASLPMASIISGRFEGATPEVKQSITDYMNGWRYEQGIIHTLDESFEQYLRRVIAHILEHSANTKKAEDAKK